MNEASSEVWGQLVNDCSLFGVGRPRIVIKSTFGESKVRAFAAGFGTSGVGTAGYLSGCLGWSTDLPFFLLESLAVFLTFFGLVYFIEAQQQPIVVN